MILHSIAKQTSEHQFKVSISGFFLESYKITCIPYAISTFFLLIIWIDKILSLRKMYQSQLPSPSALLSVGLSLTGVHSYPLELYNKI